MAIPPERPTVALIDLDRLAANFGACRQFVGSAVALMAVVKADAYGHGAVRCAERLEREGADWFAVATLEEAAELRKSGISRPVLVLGGIWPGQEAAFLALAITPVIFHIDQAETLNAAAKSRGTKAKVHIKIDTGMGRVGFRAENARDVATKLLMLSNIEVEALMTHFAVADQLSQVNFTIAQIDIFNESLAVFRSFGINPKYIDLANSPGAIAHAESRGNMVRLGGLLYGLSGDVLPPGIRAPDLVPVMSVQSRVAQVKTILKGETVGYGRTFTSERDTVIATVPIGYHDGYARALSNKGKMIIKGQIAPVVGRISMDWTTIDVSEIDDVRAGDAVTIVGSENGVSIRAEDIAALRKTISYEVTCGFAGRIPRRFKEVRS